MDVDENWHDERELKDKDFGVSQFIFEQLFIGFWYNKYTKMVI